MYKLVLILILAVISYSNTDAMPKEKPLEKEQVCQWEYWNAFSITFNETANYWAAESAALEAEHIANERTGVEEWLDEYASNQKQEKSKNSKENI